MAKVAKGIAILAGAVAVVASAGAVLGLGLAVGGSVIAASTIAAAAGVISTVASLGAQLLTKPPPARGSETQIQIAVEPPSPYLMGEAFSAGILRYRRSYGATLKKVPNPYRFMVVVASVAGPLTACTPMADFAPIGSWYSGFLYTDTQLGASPEADALTPQFAGAPNWGESSKLSGQAAIGYSMLFDKDGKRFASGLPNLGAVWQGVRVYDPRQDSNYPGGSGSQRIDDESTWAYSDNPALHAIAYAYGRYQNGKKVFGIGQPVEGIDLARFVAFANVCEANDWRISGTIYEPGDRWANLKDIMSAGCGEPVVTGGVLSVRYRAPQVSLATITEDDLAEDDLSITAMQSYRDRLNGIVPKYRNPSANWEFTSAEKVTVPTYVAEDGEEKIEERQWNLVSDVTQVTQLAAYALVDGRELGPFELTLKPQWRWLKPGECITGDFPSADFNGDLIILSREFDPGTMKVKLTCIGETTDKHDYALGQVGVPPPTPALGQTGEERDNIASAASAGTFSALKVRAYSPVIYPILPGSTNIAISETNATLSDGNVIALPADNITGLTISTQYGLFLDPLAGTYQALDVSASIPAMSDNTLLFLGWVATEDGFGVFPAPDPRPDGFGGDGIGYAPVTIAAA